MSWEQVLSFSWNIEPRTKEEEKEQEEQEEAKQASRRAAFATEPIPQCAVPFTIGARGTKTVEQDSPENTAGRVYNVAVCEQGFREDLPEYGIPPLVWKTIPLNLTGLEEALHRWEPEANLELEQQREAIAQAQITVAVEGE